MQAHLFLILGFMVNPNLLLTSTFNFVAATICNCVILLGDSLV